MIRRAAVAVEWSAWLAAWVVLLSLAAGCGVAVPTFAARPGVEPTPRPLAETNEPGMVRATEDGTVVHVVDGAALDVQLAGGPVQRVRLAGVDAPGRGECGHREATQHLRDTAPVGTPVRMTAESAATDQDRYGGSATRYVRAGDRDLSSEQVMTGWGRVDGAYPVELTPMLDVMESYAQRRGAGIWGGLCRWVG